MKIGRTQLTHLVTDPRIPLDAGFAERVIRGVVTWRKVYGGSRSEMGRQVAALFYSIVQSCRQEGLDPHAYMLEAVRRAIEDRDVFFAQELRRDHSRPTRGGPAVAEQRVERDGTGM